MPKKVTVSELRRLIKEEGMDRKQLAQHFDVPESQMKRVIKEAGLTNVKKSQAPAIILVDEVVEEHVEEVKVEEVQNINIPSIKIPESVNAFMD